MATVLINKKTGEPERFSDARAQELLLSGEWKGRPGDTITVVKGDDIRDVPAEDAEDVLRGTGSQVADTKAVQRFREAKAEDRRLEEEFGGFSPLGFAESVLSGATFGGFDVLARALGRNQFEAQQLRERGTGTGVGQVLGAIAPALVSGGTGGVAALRGATSLGSAGRAALSLTPAGLAARAGLGLSARAAAAGASRGLIGRSAARVGGLALGGAAEGALIGGGTAISREILADQDLLSEAALSRIGSEALFGAAFGAGLGGGIGLGGEAIRGAAFGIRKAGGLAKAAAQRVENRVVQRLTGEGGEATLRDIADEAVELSLKQRISVTDRAADALEREAKVLASADDDIAAGLKSFKKSRREFSASLKADDEIVERFVRNNADEAADVARRFSNDAVNLEGLIRAQRQISAPPAGSIDEIAGLSGTLADDIKAGKSFSEPSVLGDGVLERLKQEGPGLLRNASFLAGSLKVAGATRNRALALENAKALVSKGRKVLGTRSIFEIASEGAENIAKRVDDLNIARTRAAKTTARGAANILNQVRFAPESSVEAPRPASGRAHQKSENAFLARAKELRESSSNPGQTLMFLKLALAHLNTPSDIAARIAAGQMRKIQFLNEKLPASVPLGNAILGVRFGAPSAGEINKFARRVAVAEDPSVILESMKAGRLSQEEVETAKALYPGVFRLLQLGVMERATELREKLDYKQRIQLSTLYEVPVDTIMQPAMLNALQSPKVGQQETGISPQQATGQRGGRMNLGKIKNVEQPTGAQTQMAR